MKIKLTVDTHFCIVSRYAKKRGGPNLAFLELHNIHKSYFLGKEEFPVLKGIDLNFELGEFVSILGESGGGKSTLMNITVDLTVTLTVKSALTASCLITKKKNS